MTLAVAAAAAPSPPARAGGRNEESVGLAEPALFADAGIAAARRYAAARRGAVAFAVVGEDGRVRGLHRTARFPSASVVKAMLLVALLRAAGARPLSGRQRALLKPMITVSDNKAAKAVYGAVGRSGIYRLAAAAGMRNFAVAGSLFDAQLTAADQARFFLQIDRLVPPAHRRYARRLLSSIVSFQRWGIAAVARARHFKIFFKGGWRPGITHQVALLERGSSRVALAVLTRPPSMGYGEQTIAGIASRVLAR